MDSWSGNWPFNPRALPSPWNALTSVSGWSGPPAVHVRPPSGERESQSATCLPRYPKRSEEHTSELQSQSNLVCRLLLEKKKIDATDNSVEYMVVHREGPNSASLVPLTYSSHVIHYAPPTSYSVGRAITSTSPAHATNSR